MNITIVKFNNSSGLCSKNDSMTYSCESNITEMNS
jgi:hypothetical protein